MMLGVFGDVHGNLPALEAVIADGRRIGVDSWICLGDIAFRGPSPRECAELVQSVCTVCVMGNTDEWLPRTLPRADGPKASMLKMWYDWTVPKLSKTTLAWMHDLPKHHNTILGGEHLLCCHASLRALEDVVLPTSQDSTFHEAFLTDEHSLVTSAHIHIPHLLRRNHSTIINTGSVGRPIDGDPRASYVLLRTERDSVSYEFRRVEYDVQQAADLALACDMPQKHEFINAIRSGMNF